MTVRSGAGISARGSREAGMMTRLRVVGFCVCVCAASAAVVRADATPQWSDDELARFSTAIVTGRIADVATGRDIHTGAIYTYVTVALDEVFKGDIPEREIIVKQLGGQISDEGLAVFNQATFVLNENVLLFLEARPRDRTLYTTALWQGKWAIERDAGSGERMAVRPGPHGTGAGALERRTFAPLEARLRVLGGQVSQREHVRLFQASPDAGEMARTAHSPSDTIAASVLPHRWNEYDTQTPIPVDLQVGGQPGLPGGGGIELSRALAAWASPTGLSFASGETFPRCIGTVAADGRISVVFNDPCGELGDGTIAIGATRTNSSGGRTVDGHRFSRVLAGYLISNDDVQALRYLQNSGCFEAVVTHEIGHILGLADSDAPGSVMSPSRSFSRCSSEINTATADDVAAVRAIYRGTVSPQTPSAPAHLMPPPFGRSGTLGSRGTASNSLAESDLIFDYAERTYPQYLAPAGATSRTFDVYYYRYYTATDAYIATASGRFYYLGPASNRQLLDLGPISDWLAVVRPLRIDSIAPDKGPIARATEVTLRGSNLADAQISANGAAITPSFQSATEVRIRVPSGANGYVTIAARTAYGTAYVEFLRQPPSLAEIGPGDITTVAGVGTFFGDGRQATRAMIEPTDLALGSGGEIFVAEPGQARVRRIRSDGVIETYVGSGVEGFSGDGGLASESKLWQPRGIALDAAGNLYIADTWRSRIRRVAAATGIITTIAGTGTGGFSGDGGPAALAVLNLPVQLAFDSAGNLFVLECGNSRVRRIDPAGTITTVAGNGTPGFSGDGGAATAAQINIGDGIFIDVGGLAVDPSGNIYVADTNNNRIRRIERATGVIRTVAEAPGVRAVATDAQGNVYFATNALGSPQLARITKLDPQMRTVATFGRGRGVAADGTPAAEALLGFIDRVRIDQAGNILFTDFTTLRVRRINGVTGLLETVAGIGPRTIGDVGAATDAVLGTYNSDIAIDAQASLLIADGGLHRIRRIDAARRITTIAGTGVFGLSDIDDVPAIEAQIFGAMGIDLATDGSLLIVDGHAVRRIGNDGIIRLVAGNKFRDAGLSGDGGPAIGARFLQPFDVTSDAAGNLYIADTNNNRVRRVDAATGIVTTIAGSGAPNGFERYGAGATCGDGGPATSACINTPYGVALDSQGNLFISENWQRIRKVDRNGIISTLASVYATKMVVDAAGNVFAVAGNRIVRVSPQGTVTTVAGTGTPGFSGDGGSALSAQIDALGQASGIAIDASGNLYFSDGGNRRIRVVKAGGRP